MLVNLVKVRIKPEQRQRFLDAIEHDALGSERDEPGCLCFKQDYRTPRDAHETPLATCTAVRLPQA